MPSAVKSGDALVVVPQTSVRQRLMIYGYIGFLYCIWPFTGIWGTSAVFYMKDHLHMPANEIAQFLLLKNIPGYVGFIFGFVRDRWGPFGRRDQGLLILFCGLSTALLLLAVGVSFTYVSLLLVFVASSILGQFIGAALQGLTSVIAQEHLMTGRLSSVWQAASWTPAMLVSIVAGRVATDYNIRFAFLISAAVGVVVTLFVFWRPKEVYDAAETAPIVSKSFSEDAKKLIGTKALYPIILLLFIWNFTPGMGTPIQFYLTDTLHGTPTDFGNFNAIFNGCFIPSFLIYGFLCTRVKFRPLLWICTFIAVPQIMPLLMVHSTNTAMIAAVPMGLMGGPATAAYFDLLIRACPSGLQGTAMMLGASVWLLSAELGNVAGAVLYDHYHRFAPCAWATFFVYACLIPVLYFVPKHLTATQEGEVSASPA